MGNVGRQGWRCPHCDSVIYVSMQESVEYPFKGFGVCGDGMEVFKTHRQIRSQIVDSFFCSGCEAIWSGRSALMQAMHEASKRRFHGSQEEKKETTNPAR